MKALVNEPARLFRWYWRRFFGDPLDRMLCRIIKEPLDRVLYGNPLDRVFHRIGLRLGYFVIPKGIYVPFPDLTELRRRKTEWAQPSKMLGVDVDLDMQAKNLRDLVKPFQAEYHGNAFYRRAVADAAGPGFSYIDAQALYGVVRALAPKRIIEMGSGVSTFCALEAVTRNGPSRPSRITCIEPQPQNWLRSAPVELIERRMQEVPLDRFAELNAGDLLFVDTTHTVQVGGEVVRIILEVLPRLKPGVVVHFHDIHFPYDYAPHADMTFDQWQEDALLHAFLIGNRGFEFLFCLSHLHHERPDVLADVFPEYVPEKLVSGLFPGPRVPDESQHSPASTYLRVRMN